MSKSRHLPPNLPLNAPYTSCWCEENIYLLADVFSQDPEVARTWDIYIVFISNYTKTVALWGQKLARDPVSPVVWDYHVILLLRPSHGQLQVEVGEPIPVDEFPEDISNSWVYDFDTSLGVPCTLREYISGTFLDVSPQFQSLFRVIPADTYLNHFASDRSHMLVTVDGVEASHAEANYQSPPPLYKPIQGTIAARRGVSNNLMSSFVSMVPSEDSYGDVLSTSSFVLWC